MFKSSSTSWPASICGVVGSSRDLPLILGPRGIDMGFQTQAFFNWSKNFWGDCYEVQLCGAWNGPSGRPKMKELVLRKIYSFASLDNKFVLPGTGAFTWVINISSTHKFYQQSFIKSHCTIVKANIKELKTISKAMEVHGSHKVQEN